MVHGSPVHCVVQITVIGKQAVSELHSTDKTVGVAVSWIDSNFFESQLLAKEIKTIGNMKKRKDLLPQR